MKKKLLFIPVLSALTSFVQAQIKKGSIFLGGDIGITASKTTSLNDSKQTTVTFSPAFGKAIRDNLIIGGQVGFGRVKNEVEASTPSLSDNKSYWAGVFIRKYKPIGSQGFYVFAQGTFNFNHSTYHSSNLVIPSTVDTKSYAIGAGINPGIAFAVSKRLHLETGFNNILSANYSWGTEKRVEMGGTMHSKKRGFGLHSSLSNAGSSLYVGFRVLLSK